MTNSERSVPSIWLGSFFGFNPEEDGYIGWTKEADRDHVMGKIAAGDLMLIYGAGSEPNDPSQKQGILGFLQVDPLPIRDVDKASDKSMARKRENGWQEKWTYALPVRRAWRVVEFARLDMIANKSYSPDKGRAIAAWSPQLEPGEVRKALTLKVEEVPVFGEPEPPAVQKATRFADFFVDETSHFIAKSAFLSGFAHFQTLVEQKTDEQFTRFDEGLIAAWESYKPRMRDKALSILGADQWQPAQIGSGEILQSVIDAIEIQATHGDMTNNLVFWQNRFGHAQRDHRALLEAQNSAKDRTRFEQVFFDLYRTDRAEQSVFEELQDLTESKYPLLAYLFFLKDMDRFMPIHPTGFDRVFNALGSDFRTLRNCSWENYKAFNQLLDGLRGDIETAAGLTDVRLIDAHSWCWLFSTLLKQENDRELESEGHVNERYLGAREKSIADIKYSVNKTVFNANAQVIPRKVKEKELRMTDAELDKRIRALLELQGDRCAITGIPFQFQGTHDDLNLLPSLDRIDSDGHYESSNVQLVCRFINFWKQAADDAEFRRLIMLVRGDEENSI